MNKIFRFGFFCLLLVTIASLSQSCKVKPINSTAQPISHKLWDSLLSKHVTADGLVNYQGFIEDSVLLNNYLSLLSNNHPNEDHWSKDEQLAYWINAYNAFTVKLIVDNYPVQSIKEIKSGIPFVNSVWDIKFIHIESATYDLNNIEHGILRKYFDEPRIHFAVNCASISCPNLASFAYTAEDISQQLDQVAKVFLSDPTKNKITPDKIEISKIFSWYGGDFKKDATLIDYLNKYAPVQIDENADVGFMDYDWGLNEK